MNFQCLNIFYHILSLFFCWEVSFYVYHCFLCYVSFIRSHLKIFFFLYFASSWTMICLGTLCLLLIMLGIYWASWICILVFFTKLGYVETILSSKMWYPSFSPSLQHLVPIVHTLDHVIFPYWWLIYDLGSLNIFLCPSN